MDTLASVITHPSCMAECPELNKFQYNYLLYSSETEKLNCCAPAFATSFYLAPTFIYNEIVLYDTPHSHAEDRILFQL